MQRHEPEADDPLVDAHVGVVEGVPQLAPLAEVRSGREVPRVLGSALVACSATAVVRTADVVAAEGRDDTGTADNGHNQEPHTEAGPSLVDRDGEERNGAEPADDDGEPGPVEECLRRDAVP